MPQPQPSLRGRSGPQPPLVPAVVSQELQDKVVFELQELISREMGTEAVLKLRASPGLRPDKHSGAFCEHAPRVFRAPGCQLGGVSLRDHSPTAVARFLWCPRVCPRLSPTELPRPCPPW